MVFLKISHLTKHSKSRPITLKKKIIFFQF